MKKLTLALMLALAVPVTGFAEEVKTAATAASPKYDVKKLSRAFGNFIGKNISNPNFSLDVEEVVKGIQEGAKGMPSPLSEEEYEEMMTEMQEAALNKISDENLKKAEEFLTTNGKVADVKTLEGGKLQVLVLQPGNGEEVKEGMNPLIHYTGKYVDGSTFGTSVGSDPLTIPLSQTIPGFQKGLVGAKVGEKRKLFIHPDLGYGKSGQLAPNSLLIFEIEVLKADSPQAFDADGDEEDDDFEDEEITS